MKKILLAILSVVIVSSLNVWASTYQNGYQYKNIVTKGDYTIYQVVYEDVDYKVVRVGESSFSKTGIDMEWKGDRIILKICS